MSGARPRGAEPPKLPVYLVHFEAPDWCASACRSVLASEGVDVSLTVIDNGGGGYLEAVLPAGVRVVRTPENLGYTGGANAALADVARVSRDASCVVIGSHDLHVEPDCLARLVAAVEADPSIGAAGPDTDPFGADLDGDRASGAPAMDVPGAPLTAAPETVEEVPWLPGSCLILRRAALQQIGGLRPEFSSYVEDVELCHRLRRAGWRVVRVGQARASGLGSRSARATALTVRGHVLLARADHGRVAAAAAAAKSASWALRSAIAAAAPWLHGSRRQLARPRAVAQARGTASGTRWIFARLPAPPAVDQPPAPPDDASR